VKWLGYDISEASWIIEADLDDPAVKEEIGKFEQLQVE
jgi:hypothetical protein